MLFAGGMSASSAPSGGKAGGEKAKGTSSKSFNAGKGASFTFNFNFIPSAPGEGGISTAPGAQSSSSSSQGGAARGGGPSFCFNFNIPAAMAPQFSSFASQISNMANAAGDEAPPVEALTITPTAATAKPAAAPAAAPVSAASSARPWEAQGIKPVETPAWAKAATGGDAAEKKVRLDTVLWLLI